MSLTRPGSRSVSEGSAPTARLGAIAVLVVTLAACGGVRSVDAVDPGASAAGGGGAAVAPEDAGAEFRSAVASPLRDRDCEGLPSGSRCHELDVYENRETRAGRTIGLDIVVLEATGDAPLPDPVFFLQGGPGGAATMLAPILAISSLREDRDIVLVDQRGTGGSGGLNCPTESLPEMLSTFASFDFEDELATCRDGQDADLTRYITTIAMDDLEDVREALGYDEINLLGGSYGTRAALVYLRRHGDRVRTATLTGVAPTTFKLPLDFPQDSRNALHYVLDDCAADEACSEAFPNVRDELQEVLERLETETVDVETRDPFTGEDVTITVDRKTFVASLHYSLYQSMMASRIPSMIHAAHGGDFKPSVDLMGMFANALVRQISMGMFLSVVCTEDIPHYDEADIVREARDTYLGETMARNLRSACERWPRADLPANYRDPVTSDVPVLLLTGAADPVTAPRHGEEAERHLANAEHFVIPHEGHTLIATPCVNEMIRAFVAEGTLEGLDASCIDGLRPNFYVN